MLWYTSTLNTYYMQTIIHYPSLYIVCSGHDATWYKVSDQDTLKEINTIHTNDPDYSDREGHFKAGGRGVDLHQGQPDDTNEIDQETLQKHIKSVVEKTVSLIDEIDYQHVVCALPEHIKGELLLSLKEEIKDTRIRTIFGNYTTVKKDLLLQKFHEALKPSNKK